MENKVVGVLGCGGAVGKPAVTHLLKKYSVLGGQRHPIDFGSESFQWVQTDFEDPQSLRNFCEKCDIVVNTAGPSSKIRDRVARCALEVGCDYIDASGETIFLDRHEPIYTQSKQAIVIGAGFEAGLTGLVPYKLVKDFDHVDEAFCYCGSRQRISLSSLVDLLSSCFIDSGFANAFYREGEIVPHVVPGEELFNISGFRDEVYLKPYVSNEVLTMAKQCNISELRWYHAVAELETMGIMNDMFQSVNHVADKDFQYALVKRYQKVFDAIANTRPYFNTVFYDLKGLKDGRPIRLGTTVQVKESYEICGLVAACTAEHLLKHPTCHGVSWACEILDPDKVLAICLETGAISDFRTVSLDINEEVQGQSFVPQLEDGEIA